MANDTYHARLSDSNADVLPEYSKDELLAVNLQIEESVKCAKDIVFSDIISDLFGKSTIDDGGSFGKIMNLLRSHITSSKNDGEINSQQVSELLRVSIESALSASLDIEFKKRQMNLDAQEKKVALLMTVLESKGKIIEYHALFDKMKKESYELNNILPLEREKVKEEIEALHVDHQILSVKLTNEGKIGVGLDDKHSIDKYTIDQLLPQKLLLDTAQSNLSKKSLEFETYKFTNMLPLEKDKLLKENIILDDKHGLEAFNLTNIMPLEELKSSKENILLDDKHGIESYRLDTMLPTEVDSMITGTALKSKDLDLKSYELTNIMPKKLDLETAKKDLAEKELEFETYKFVNMMPLEKTKLENETNLIATQRDTALVQNQIAEVDRLIKVYYKDNIQPQEMKEVTAKAHIEYISSGAGVNANSLPKKKLDVMDKQLLVYDEQVKHYQTDKDLQLMKMISNYQSMIYPDLDGGDQSVLAFVGSAGTVFNRLNN